MHIVVVGGGGREHALAWKLQQSSLVRRISITAHNFATEKFCDLAPSSAAALTDFCKQESVSLAVVGPEAPLADGLSDFLRAAKIPVLGPSRAAAQIESSKIFSKQLMQKCGVRTAKFAVADSVADVQKWCDSQPPPFVLKADGLAAGKGVVICDSAADAIRTAAEMLGGKFGAASSRILLEEHLRGREMSFIALTDGTNAIPLASSRDYKRLQTGDNGPNTGGMGAVSPAPNADDSLCARIMDEVIHPALCGMREKGAPFCGFLYAGLMIAGGDIHSLEFNCRLGDPETQAILPRWAGDCLPAFLAAANGDLSGGKIDWRAQTSIAVVFAAAGYPENPRKGDTISLPDLESEFNFASAHESNFDSVSESAPDFNSASESKVSGREADSSVRESESESETNASARESKSESNSFIRESKLRLNSEKGAVIFHAGTKTDAKGNPITNGGRVLSAVALGDDFATAKQRAYAVADKIQFPGMQFRTDIGE